MAAFSDNFEGASLDSRWIERDPLADVTVSIVSGQLSMASPAVLHDYWTTNNDACKIVQPVPNTDFEVVAKFNALPSNNGEGVGITIEQDTTAANSLRCGIYSTGSGALVALFSKPTTVWVSEVITGSVSGSVIWVKMTKVGTTFTFSWSDDGVSFTTPTGGSQVIAGFTTNHIGTYTRNAAANAFTGLVEFIEFASDAFGNEFWMESMP